MKKKQKLIFAWNDTKPDNLDGLCGRDAVKIFIPVTVIAVFLCIKLIMIGPETYGFLAMFIILVVENLKTWK